MTQVLTSGIPSYQKKETNSALRNLYRYQSVQKAEVDKGHVLKFLGDHSQSPSKNAYDVDRNVGRKMPINSLADSNSYQEIKSRMKDSNIFTELKQYPFASTRTNKYNTNTAIMCNIIPEKASETYLDKTGKKQYYGCTTLSNSSWKPKDSITNLVGHSSVPYSVINPKIKNISKTRQDLLQNSDSKLSPINYQKSVCEFTDLIKVSSNNSNKIYVDTLKSEGNVFKMRNDVCNTFGNLFQSYQGVIQKPFYTKKN